MAENDKPEGQQPEALASLAQAARGPGMKPQRQGLNADPETYPRPDDPDREADTATRHLRAGAGMDNPGIDAEDNPGTHAAGGGASASSGSDPIGQAGSFTGSGSAETARHSTEANAPPPSGTPAQGGALARGLRRASDSAEAAARDFAEEFRAGRDPLRAYGQKAIEQVERQPVTAMILAVAASFILARLTARR